MTGTGGYVVLFTTFMKPVYYVYIRIQMDCTIKVHTHSIALTKTHEMHGYKLKTRVHEIK